MFVGTALSVRLFVCAGLSLFIIYGPYLYVVVCVFYAYNLTFHLSPNFSLKVKWYKVMKERNKLYLRVNVVYSLCFSFSILAKYASTKSLYSPIEGAGVRSLIRRSNCFTIKAVFCFINLNRNGYPGTYLDNVLK